MMPYQKCFTNIYSNQMDIIPEQDDNFYEYVLEGKDEKLCSQIRRYNESEARFIVEQKDWEDQKECLFEENKELDSAF